MHPRPHGAALDWQRAQGASPRLQVVALGSRAAGAWGCNSMELGSRVKARVRWREKKLFGRSWAHMHAHSEPSNGAWDGTTSGLSGGTWHRERVTALAAVCTLGGHGGHVPPVLPGRRQAAASAWPGTKPGFSRQGVGPQCTQGGRCWCWEGGWGSYGEF